MALRIQYFLLAILPCLSGSLTTSAQDADYWNALKIQPFGFDGFQLMFQQSGLTTETDLFEQIRARPQETILIVLGDSRKRTSELLPRLASFVQHGGALLVATDLGEPRLANGFDVVFHQGPVHVENQDAYMGFPDCPIVREFRHNHPLFAGVRELITNRPGKLMALVPEKSNQVLARLPESSRWPWRRRGAESIGNAPLIVSREARNGGRVLFVADHSVFANMMLMHGDNARFAWNCVSWLEKGQSRTSLLFVENGQASRTYQFGAPPLPKFRLDRLLKNTLTQDNESLRAFANRFVTSLEDSNVFNRTLAGPQDLGQRPIRQAVALLACAAVAFMFVRWLVFSRSRVVGPVSSVPAADTTNHRAAELIRLGRFDSSAQSLAREFFVRDMVNRGLQATIMDWQSLRQPRWNFGLPLWQALRSRGRVRFVWKVATRSGGPPMRKRRFKRFLRSLQWLEELRRAGRLHTKWELGGS